MAETTQDQRGKLEIKEGDSGIVISLTDCDVFDRRSGVPSTNEQIETARQVQELRSIALHILAMQPDPNCGSIEEAPNPEGREQLAYIERALSTRDDAGPPTSVPQYWEQLPYGNQYFELRDRIDALIEKSDSIEPILAIAAFQMHQYLEFADKHLVYSEVPADDLLRLGRLRETA